ncbi:MAG TPA: LysR substrate-binding domain-containing protein [Prolixibacteraceae bacterium]|nr:LysR substrate-binding domain-containing protein [Prolixibacteraceae bacterium]
MTLLQLTYVLALSENKTFSDAAKKLGISQPALSLQIRKLEEELGLNLFHRSSSPITVTQEGALFIEKARELLKLADSLKDLPVEMEMKPEGILRIGVIPTLAPYWFPMFLNRFSQSYPAIQLTVKELKTEDVLSGLKSGSLDAGFLSTPVDVGGIHFTPLFYERFFMYLSDRHELFSFDEIDLKKIDLKEVWYLSEGNCFQNQVDSICMFAHEPGPYQNVVYLSDSIESLCRVVEISGGMTFLPELATLSVSSDKEDMIKEIKGGSPVREISLATSRFIQSSRLINFFLEKALEVIPQRMRNLPGGKPLDTKLSVL